MARIIKEHSTDVAPWGLWSLSDFFDLVKNGSYNREPTAWSTQILARPRLTISKAVPITACANKAIILASWAPNEPDPLASGRCRSCPWSRSTPRFPGIPSRRGLALGRWNLSLGRVVRATKLPRSRGLRPAEVYMMPLLVATLEGDIVPLGRSWLRRAASSVSHAAQTAINPVAQVRNIAHTVAQVSRATAKPVMDVSRGISGKRSSI